VYGRYHCLAHLITTWPDARPNTGDQVGRAAAKFALHRCHHRPRQIFYRALPAGVPQADGLMRRVVEQNGRAVSKIHRQGAARFVGEDGVDARQPGPVVGLGYAGHVTAVYQMGMNDGVGVTAVQPIRPPPVGVHSLFLVRHRHAQVQRIKWGRADAALPGEDGVLDTAVRRQTRKLQKRNVI